MMHRQMIFKCLSGTFLAMCAVPVFACSDLPNICQMNAQHHQNMQDIGYEIAEANYWQQQDDIEAEGERYYHHEPSYGYDPTLQRMNVAGGVANIMANHATRLEQIKNDPRFKDFEKSYENGAWEFFQDEAKAKNGEYCAALYWKKDSFVRVSGPGDDYKGALLTFWGPNIPKPEKQQTIKVTLYQNADAPQNVQVFNYTLPDYAYGAISIAVPTLDALLDNMEDQFKFEIKQNGQSIANSTWHDGLLAKKMLTQCAQGK